MSQKSNANTLRNQQDFTAQVDMLSITVTQDSFGVFNVHVNCNDHDFDSDLLSELIDKVLEAASSVVQPVTLQ